MDTHLRPARRIAAVAGIVLGLAAGSYGIASAASGSSSAAPTAATTTTSGLASSPSTTAGPTAQAAPSASNPWGGQRRDETLLTGDAKARVQSAALATVPGGTIVRIETDADGHPAYEAHMTKQDGTHVTVYVDQQFNVVSVESR